MRKFLTILIAIILAVLPVIAIFFVFIYSDGRILDVFLSDFSNVFPIPFRLILILLIFGYYGMYVIIFFVFLNKEKKQDNKAKLLSTYKKIEKISHREKDTETIYTYIKDNYHDPNISLDSIVTTTGLSRKRITTLTQQEYNMSLKECINWLRLVEAKRLLCETDLNITEIAFTLGYSSSSYFGVLFKNQEGVSPKEFRKKQQPEENP